MSDSTRVWMCAFCGHATTFGSHPQYCRGSQVGARNPHAPYRMVSLLAVRDPRDDTSEQVDPRLRASLGFGDMTTIRDHA